MVGMSLGESHTDFNLVWLSHENTFFYWAFYLLIIMKSISFYALLIKVLSSIPNKTVAAEDRKIEQENIAQLESLKSHINCSLGE